MDRKKLVLLLGALLVQVVLGISTLLLHVPVALAAAHQGGAVLLLSAAVFVSHVLVRQRRLVGRTSSALDRAAGTAV